MMQSGMKKVLFSIIMTTVVISVCYIFDLFVGVIYDNVAPEFGKKNLDLALRVANGNKAVLQQSPHPYLTYVNTPDYYKNGIRQHNNLGYRQKNNVEQLKDSSTLRILVLGGSTTYGQGVEAPEDAWPSIIHEWLNAKSSNYKVEIVNGGMPWATSAELLNHYIFRDRYLEPDIVILHTGGNDGGPLKFSGYSPEYTHWRTIKAGGKNSLRPGEKGLIEASNFIKLFYSIWFSRIGYAIPRAYIHTNSSAKLSKEEALINVTNNEPLGFSRNLSLLLRNIKQDGAIPLYFHFYAPGKEMFSEKGKSALKEANRIVNFTEFFEVNKIALNKIENAARLITNENDVEFVQIENGAIPVEYFVDQCHLNRLGQEYKANFIIKYIVPYIEKLTIK